MAIFAYIRVSCTEQCTDRQIIAMAELKIPLENIFTDKLSGKNMARPELQKLMTTAKSGDTIIVESVSRFARNTRDLLVLIDKLTAKNVKFISQKENINTSTPTGKFMLTVFGAVSELEREYLLQRQREGIAAARARGVHLGRPTKKLPENFDSLVNQWEHGNISISDILTQTGLKEATFYRRLREWRLLKGKK
ncbi:MAG: recombinase family protein [Lachnospiraceae bacterium]|nr:recombinase family protein [Lachnospiraceae bacterium]